MLEVKIQQKLEKLYNEAERIRQARKGEEAEQRRAFKRSRFNFKWLMNSRVHHKV